MPVLYFFENLRTPFLNGLMSALTFLGSEEVFLLFAVAVFWCVDKYEGYYILSLSFLGTIINQFLKITFRIERPWIKDPSFSIVESAREGASGYSFPSGHTQSATGLFGGIGRWSRRRWVKILCAAFIIITPVTRLYLGVHTPLDVSVSFAIGLALVFLLYPFIKKGRDNPRYMWILFSIMLLCSAGFLGYMLFKSFPGNTDASKIEEALQNAYSFFGCILGICTVYFLDSKYIKFKTDASFPMQLIKLSLGAAILIVLKLLLKEPLFNLFEGYAAANAVRYFVLVVFAGGVWPLTFKFFRKKDGEWR